MEPAENPLDKKMRRAAVIQELCLQQMDRIEQMARNGMDTASAERLLGTLLWSLEVRLSHLRCLQRHDR